MSWVAVQDVHAEVDIQSGAIVSKIIHRDELVNVTVFGLDAGQEMTEHTAARAALVQVVSGRLRFIADEHEFDAGPGFWLHMAPNTPHSLVASEPTIMLLTLLRP